MIKFSVKKSSDLRREGAGIRTCMSQSEVVLRIRKYVLLADSAKFPNRLVPSLA